MDRTLSNISVVSPTLRRQNAACRPRLPSPQIVDHRLPIQSISNGSPHPRIFQNGISNIEAQVSQPGSRSAFDGKVRFALQCDHGIGRIRRINRHVGAAFPQFQCLRRRVRHYGESHPSQLCPVTPIFIVAFKDDLSISLRADKLKWPRTNRMLRHLIAAAVRHNAHRAFG